jgi:Tfp pilus assembly protein PilE
MIVVVIIGILAAIALPRFSLASWRAKEKEAEGVLKQVYTLQGAHYQQHSRFAVNATELQTIGFTVPLLQYYAWNNDVGASPYCLSAMPAGANHDDRCIDLETGEISGR